MSKKGLSILLLLVNLLVLAEFNYVFATTAQLTILVIDEEAGEPINGASAEAIFSTGGWESKSTRVVGLTNSDGKYVVRGDGIGRVQYGASCKGYYSSGFKYTFDPRKSPTQLRYTPWNPEVTVKMRRIKNPVPVYSVSVLIRIPELDKKIGFDLMESDWVAPYGKGKRSDFIFEVHQEFKSILDYRGVLTLSFANQFDGIYIYPIELNHASELPIPHLAPVSGYEPTLVKIRESKPREDWPERGVVTNTINEKQHYYFRVRSIEKDGKFDRAMHGKLYGDIEFSAYTGLLKHNRDKMPAIKFWYILNPDWTRNTEEDLKKNLFVKEVKRTSKSIEERTAIGRH